MATLAQICILPDGWGAAPVMSEGARCGYEKKMAWKDARKKERERMAAFRERENKRARAAMPLGKSRIVVFRETISEPVRIEGCRRMFEEGKGRRSEKNARNGFSREEAGTVGSTVMTRRFAGSRLTCVYKTKKI